MTFVISCEEVMHLERGDYDRALALIGTAAGSDHREPFSREVLNEFLNVVTADWCGYTEWGWATQPKPGVNTYFVDTPTHFTTDLSSEDILRRTESWPLRDRKVVSPEPRKLSDFLRPAELLRNAWYQECLRPMGARYEMKLWLEAPAGTVRTFHFVRSRDRRDFDERDRSMLSLLRPHLGSIRARWERRHHPPGLTPREAEILDLLSVGMTNAAIAQTLVVSPLTVRRHLENIFAKLGVHSRTEAVAVTRDRSNA